MATEAAIQPAPARATAVVVLGAGRSGTSALTRGIQSLGVDLGSHLRPAGGKNPTGFFEDSDLLALNKRLKRALGIYGHSLRLFDEAEWEAPAVLALQDEAVAIIRRNFGDTPLWGYKYGRTLRMLPFWQEVFRKLDLDVRYAVALRNPLSVARSRAKLNPERGRTCWSCLEWLVNVVPYFREVRGHPFVVVDFDAMLEAPNRQLERMAGQLELPVNGAVRASMNEYAGTFLRAGMRHSQFQPEDLKRDADVHPLVAEAFTWLHRLAHDQVRPGDEDFWSAWGRIEADLGTLNPLLKEMDWLRDQLDRSRWNPFSIWLNLQQLWRSWKSH